MTRVTQGARQRHFILWLGVRVDVVNLKHSVRYESPIRETRLHPSQLYMLISGFIILLIVNPIIVHVPSIVSLASPRFRALPPTTNIEQPLLLSYKTQTNIIF